MRPPSPSASERCVRISFGRATASCASRCGPAVWICWFVKGSTPVAERQALMNEFNGDGTIPILLLSMKECDLENNLESASVCIMHDLDCNPFNDLQAEEYVRISWTEFDVVHLACSSSVAHLGISLYSCSDAKQLPPDRPEAPRDGVQAGVAAAGRRGHLQDAGPQVRGERLHGRGGR
jgi:hypothetical protein